MNTQENETFKSDRNTRADYESYAADFLADRMIPMEWEEWKRKMDAQDEAMQQLHSDRRNDRDIGQYESYIAGLQKERDEAIAECIKRKGIEQDMNAYKEQADALAQKLGALLIFSQSGRIAGHQLDDAERDELYAKCTATLSEYKNKYAFGDWIVCIPSQTLERWANTFDFHVSTITSSDTDRKSKKAIKEMRETIPH
jgi:phosphoribosyl-ATP pyrophosphohydrolase